MHQGPPQAATSLARRLLSSAGTRRDPHLAPELGPELVAALADLERDYLSRHLESLVFFDWEEREMKKLARFFFPTLSSSFFFFFFFSLFVLLAGPPP